MPYCATLRFRNSYDIYKTKECYVLNNCINILVTGAAGFIGFHFARSLAHRKVTITGADNLNDYYDPALKRARLSSLERQGNFEFREVDLGDREAISKVFAESPAFDVVVHLAAQAGVRYSLERPDRYIDSNVIGFGNILECCRRSSVAHLIFASSSSVYGANTRMPFCETDTVDHAMSLYAATKKANEVMAHSYASLYGLPCTGLRFFTVYGPWGRPDMAYFLFTRAIDRGETIDVFNHGEMKRDFTYVDDVVSAMIRLLDRPARPDPCWSGDQPNPATSYAPYRLYNIGNHRPEPLGRLIELIEEHLGKSASKRLLQMQPGDVSETYADCRLLSEEVGYEPNTPLEVGIGEFVKWYRQYYS